MGKAYGPGHGSRPDGDRGTLGSRRAVGDRSAGTRHSSPHRMRDWSRQLIVT